MSLRSTQKTGNTVELEIAVSPEELREATAKVFRRKAKSITVPGFRKGKAPRQVIERMYGEGVFMEDAVNDLYPKAYGEAVDEAGVEPVDRADVEILTVDKEEGLVFKATVTVKPEVELSGYTGIKAEKIIHPVLDSDIDAEVERMRERNARIITVTDRPAKDGDEVMIDFEGFVGGEAFEGGKAEGHKITLGSQSFIDTFEQQIEGHSIGDAFEVNVTFPEQYHAEELKGKPAMFKVVLHEIKGRELPELDDEFAKDVSEFDTLEELRGDIKKRREEAAEQRSCEELENSLMDEVIKGLTADIPEVMMENRTDEMVRDFEYRISAQGMNLDMYLQYTGMNLDAFRKSFGEQAERQVKTRLALEKIAELEKLEATEEDINAELLKIAESHKVEVEKVKEFVPAKELAADIKATKAIDFVRDNAVVTEKTAQPEDEPMKKPAAAAKKSAAKKPKAAENKTEEKDAEKPAAAKKPAAKKTAASKKPAAKKEESPEQ